MMSMSMYEGLWFVSNVSRYTIGGVIQMDGLHRLTGGLGDLVVNIGALDLGHNVAVLDLNRDELNLGVAHAVLGSNLTTSMLDFRSY